MRERTKLALVVAVSALGSLHCGELTGTAPTYHGTETRAQHLPQEVETLAELLGARGYSTAFVTTNPNVASFFGFGQGFDEMIELFDRRAPGRVEDAELIATSVEATPQVMRQVPRHYQRLYRAEVAFNDRAFHYFDLVRCGPG